VAEGARLRSREKKAAGSLSQGGGGKPVSAIREKGVSTSSYEVQAGRIGKDAGAGGSQGVLLKQTQEEGHVVSRNDFGERLHVRALLKLGEGKGGGISRHESGSFKIDTKKRGEIKKRRMLE